MPALVGRLTCENIVPHKATAPHLSQGKGFRSHQDAEPVFSALLSKQDLKKKKFPRALS